MNDLIGYLIIAGFWLGIMVLFTGAEGLDSWFKRKQGVLEMATWGFNFNKKRV